MKLFGKKLTIVIVVIVIIISFVGSMDLASGGVVKLGVGDIDSSGSSGSGDNPASGILSERIDELNDLKIVAMGEGEQTGEYAYAMITHLTNLIYNGIQSEYSSLASVERSSDDTHKNAMLQDSWLWQFDSSMEQEVKDYLQYNLSCVLIGQNVLTFTPQEFSVAGNEYNNLKAQGAFSREENGTLRKLANKMYHTGYYFYELDKMAEYVLKYVVGTDVVSRDLEKFYDVNDNGSFDYVENYLLSESSATYNIIKGYRFADSDDRAECSRNGVWDRIEWMQNTTAPIVVSDAETTGKEAKDIIVASQVESERAYTLDEIENILNAKCVTNGLNAEQTAQFLVNYKQANNSSVFSGFKNYTNTIYFLFYNAMNNFTFNLDGESVVIENVLTMTHMPNILEDFISIQDSMYNEELDKFMIPCREYKSVLVTANTLARPMNNFYIVMYSDMQTTLQVDVMLRYHFTNDDYREMIGDYTGESRTVEARIMTLNVSPNDYAQGNINLTITPESLPKLQEKGYSSLTEDDITEMAKLGVYNIVLDKYVPYSSIDPSYKGSWFKFLEGYTAIPNASHLGSSFVYQNEYADFLEIVFDVRGSYSEKVNYGFGFIWL